MNYYNENDQKSAAWLRELISAGHIAPGIVDTRSIHDVRAADLGGYDQCHFFAGIGGWSLALRLAGWPDDRPVWTGSCPCQPFSSAGKQLGEKDERHLWPEFRRLIAECSPAIVFGEQVASKAGRQWLAGVRADLEDVAYAVGAADLCAPGVGAPHIRQRLYWFAHAECHAGKSRGIADEPGEGSGTPEGRTSIESGRCGLSCRMADNDSQRLAGRSERDGQEIQSGERAPCRNDSGGCGASGGMGDAEQSRLEGYSRNGHDGNKSRRIGEIAVGSTPEAGGIGNFWSRFDLLHCLDGKTRRIEPGTFPLAHGIPGRVGILRGYGNAIVPELAAQFIQAAEEALGMIL